MLQENYNCKEQFGNNNQLMKCHNIGLLLAVIFLAIIQRLMQSVKL